MTVKTLLPFLGAPYLDPLLDEPFHHKGRLICNAPDAVKHEHQQDIELFLPGQPLDDLQLVPVFCPDFVARDSLLLFLMDDGPAHFVTEGTAGFPLHGNVGLVFVIVVHLFVGGNAIQCANPVFHDLSNAPDAVKHEHQQDVELFLLCQILDDLQLVTILCSDFVAGNTFLLFLMDNGPAHLVTEGPAGFPLHGNVGLVFVIVVLLFVGGNAIQCANPVFHDLSPFHWFIQSKGRCIHTNSMQFSRCTVMITVLIVSPF